MLIAVAAAFATGLGVDLPFQWYVGLESPTYEESIHGNLRGQARS
jgi:hypothetical protein